MSAELTRSKTTAENLFENAPVGIFQSSLAGRMIRANLRLAMMFGYDSAAALVADGADIPSRFYTNPEERRALIREVVAQEGSEYLERQVALRHPQGSLINANLRVWAVRDRLGEVMYLEGFVEDIGAWQQVEEALRASEDRYHSLFKNMLNGFAYGRMIFDAQGKPVDYQYLAVNRAFEQLTGLKNVVGRKVTEVIPGINESNPELVERYGRVAMTGRPERFETEVRPLGRWFSAGVYSPQRDHFVSVFEDITGRKQAEVALRESEALFRAMIASLPLAIYVTSGPGHKSEYLNARFTQMLGYTLDDLPTIEAWWPLAYPDETYRRQLMTEWESRVRRAIETNSAIEPMEAVVTCKDGSRKHFMGGFIPLGDKNYCFGMDMTERRQAEAAVRESQALLETRVRERTAELEASNRALRESEHLLHRANGTLQVIRDCHEVMLRANTERDLLENVCRLVVQTGKKRLAWVGFGEDNAQKTVRPVAVAGLHPEYLKAIHISWADTPQGRGPVGTAIRTGRVQLCSNLLTDPNFAPWREVARQFGFGSTLSLPLKVNQQCLGVLSIYAAETDAFDTADQQLFAELANDLAFGLNLLRLRDEKKRLEEASLKFIEREQERLGSDLHDGLGQLLVSIGFACNLLQRDLAAEAPLAAAGAGAILSKLNQAIVMTRQLARGLHPVKLQTQGLPAALQEIADAACRDFSVSCATQCDPAIVIQDQAVATHLYRITQEAVHNAIKHAQSRHILISLAAAGGQISLSVADDGIGIPQDVESGTGMGLVIMRYRAGMIGSALKIQRADGGGTIISCSLAKESA